MALFIEMELEIATVVSGDFSFHATWKLEIGNAHLYILILNLISIVLCKLLLSFERTLPVIISSCRFVRAAIFFSHSFSMET